jgi:hypothetical protein
MNAGIISDELLVTLTVNLAASGLIPRGTTTYNNQTVILIGHGGSSIWPHFSAWLANQNPLPENPLDTWSKQIITAAATGIGGQAVFPSDKPYLPFQQWAMEAEGLRPSPLGILIHPVYGLWHAYRGAIILPEKLIQSPEKLSRPCDSCVEKPCLSACPVSAFSDSGYDVATCRSHLHSPAGVACMASGCKARRACPVGREYTYEPEQMRFHMAAFV